MSQWHVSRDGKQREPMTLDAVRMAIQLGEILPTDLAWTEGMAEWQSVGTLPAFSALFATASAAAPVGVVSYQRPASEGPIVCTEAAIQSLRGTRPWVRFFAVILFIFAGLVVIGMIAVMAAAGMSSRSRSNGMEMLFIFIAYGIMGFIYVLLGLYLNRFASNITGLLNFRREDQLEAALESQRKFWRLCGVILIVVIGLYVVIIFGVIGLGMFHRL